MPFDFESTINRQNTWSTKWGKYSNPDVIPMWVADMDFETAPVIKEALLNRVQHGIFGYTKPTRELNQTVCQYLNRDFDWTIDEEWIVWLPSLVVGLSVVSRAFANKGEGVLTSVPIYPPFLSAPRLGERETITAPLTKSNNRWVMDFDALERAVTAQTRVMLFCSPHNPTGRVWDREELKELVSFCHKHNLVLVSDEIHSGLIMDIDKKHIPSATINEAEDLTVTLLSASKTFNLPGLGCAFAIIKNPTLRKQMQKTMAGIVHHVGALGYTATYAALKDGQDWQIALVDYLRENRDLVERSFHDYRFFNVNHTEATYLSWIDVRDMPMENPANYFESHGVGLYDGTDFGAPGFLRVNFACPRPLLKSAIDRITDALENADAEIR